jgi:hypothetical protein
MPTQPRPRHPRRETKASHQNPFAGVGQWWRGRTTGKGEAALTSATATATATRPSVPIAGSEAGIMPPGDRGEDGRAAARQGRKAGRQATGECGHSPRPCAPGRLCRWFAGAPWSPLRGRTTTRDGGRRGEARRRARRAL